MQPGRVGGPARGRPNGRAELERSTDVGDAALSGKRPPTM
jgi:hypothetical protein